MGKKLKEFAVRLLYRTLFPFLIWVIYRAISLTWKITISEPDLLKQALHSKTPVIFAHWHGDEIVLLGLIGHYRVATISSSSVDGDMMNQLIHLVGGKTSRGSSTRGGVGALKGLIRWVRAGYNCSFAVDGPKGPIYQVKPGIFELSRALDCQIYACGVSCDRAWRFEKSWNKTYFPKPFAKISVNWQGPMAAVKRDQDPREASLAMELKNALHCSTEASTKKNFATPS